MSTNPVDDEQLDELLTELSANVGEEYHKLHSGKQDFALSDSRMKFYENAAKQRLLKWRDESVKTALRTAPPEQQPLSDRETYDRGYNSGYIAGRRATPTPQLPTSLHSCGHSNDAVDIEHTNTESNSTIVAPQLTNDDNFHKVQKLVKEGKISDHAASLHVALGTAPQLAVDELQDGIEQYILWQLVYLKRQLKAEVSAARYKAIKAQATMMAAEIAKRYHESSKLATERAKVEGQIKLVESLLEWRDQESDPDGQPVGGVYQVFCGADLEALEWQVLPDLKRRLRTLTTLDKETK